MLAERPRAQQTQSTFHPYLPGIADICFEILWLIEFWFPVLALPVVVKCIL